ncbi:Hypothetical predicted protein [Pelobates cultripes]|uniref:Uncharacterized protein n=1 Tax=Pelobates cultripes TaxID=61616 RepID=A0AAD1RGZ2_PELCU|nr:Hypothetical predicted protein [Pelobates cultripes]
MEGDGGPPDKNYRGGRQRGSHPKPNTRPLTTGPKSNKKLHNNGSEAQKAECPPVGHPTMVNDLLPFLQKLIATIGIKGDTNPSTLVTAFRIRKAAAAPKRRTQGHYSCDQGCSDAGRNSVLLKRNE